MMGIKEYRLGNYGDNPAPALVSTGSTTACTCAVGGQGQLMPINKPLPEPLPELVEGSPYEDIPGFCSAAPLERVRELDYVLTPGRYVGLPDEEDDFDFEERFTELQAELAAQLAEESRLNALIQENLAKVEFANE